MQHILYKMKIIQKSKFNKNLTKVLIIKHQNKEK
jgi:hypothetical protein